MPRNLTRYLRFAVLGKTDHPRRSPRRRAPSRGPARDWKYRAWIRTFPCAACGSSFRVEAAHTGTDGGMKQKASDYSCLPLCHDCHQADAVSYHRNRAELLRLSGLDFQALVLRFNAVWRAMRECSRGEGM